MIAVHVHRLVARLALVTVLATAPVTADAAAAASPASSGPRRETVVANDNRHPAGTLDRGLRAGRGAWQPERPAGPTLSIEAFGETSSSLAVPAPMIRVEEAR